MVSVGSTYAWFTANDTATMDISMGELGVQTDLEALADDDGIDLEPGLNVETNGSIENTGSLYAMVKIEDDSQVTYKDTEEAVPVPENTVDFSFVPESGNYEDWDNGIVWYTDGNGGTYLLMDPAATVALDVTADLNGEAIDNSFMGADVTFKINAHAVQALEGAVSSEFDVELASEGSAKVKTIKAVKDITGLGLKDAKGLVDNIPSVIKEGVSKDEAEDIKAKLEEVGATVNLK